MENKLNKIADGGHGMICKAWLECCWLLYLYVEKFWGRATTIVQNVPNLGAQDGPCTHTQRESGVRKHS